MSNTTIQLKKSSTPSSKPLDLANGELAINFADGKLYYKNTGNYVVEYTSPQSSDFGTVSANGTLLVADTAGDVLTILPGNNINITADAINDRITIALSDDVIIPPSGSFKIMAVGGNEGGEIKLANAITNSGVSGDVIIDVWQNHIRFFESGGTNRGAYINLALAATGVGTNLLATSSGTTDTTARDIASSAYNQANTANDIAVSAFAAANAGGASVTTSNTAPSTPEDGDLWWDTDLGKLFIYYDDGSSAQWVDAGAGYDYPTVNTFLDLTDTPSSYANAAGQLVSVNPGGTGLQFTDEITIDELVHTARVAPTVVANDSVTVYVTATGTSPNREVAYKIKNEFGEEVIISSILT